MSNDNVTSRRVGSAMPRKRSPAARARTLNSGARVRPDVLANNASPHCTQSGGKVVPGDALTQAVEDGPCESDRRFFKQHPARCYRLRPAWACEIAHFARADLAISARPDSAFSRELPADHCWWIAVRQVRPGARIRVPFQAPHDLPPESSEDDARGIWLHVRGDWDEQANKLLDEGRQA